MRRMMSRSAERRGLDCADVLGERAPGAETAAARRIDRVGRIVGKRRGLDAPTRIGPWSAFTLRKPFEFRSDKAFSLATAIRPEEVYGALKKLAAGDEKKGSETIAETIKCFAQYEDGKTAPVALIHCSDGLWYAAKREELEALFLNSTAATSGSRR